MGKYRADGQGESEDPWDSVQHTQTGSGKSTDGMRGDFLGVLGSLSRCSSAFFVHVWPIVNVEVKLIQINLNLGGLLLIVIDLAAV